MEGVDSGRLRARHLRLAAHKLLDPDAIRRAGGLKNDRHLNLRALSEAELEQKGRELRDELFNAKIRHATGQLENTALLGQTPQGHVARVETLLTQKREAGK